MYYTIREEKRNELKEGKTISYIANKLHYSRQYTSYIFNGLIKINVATIIKILFELAKESNKINNMLNEKGNDFTINYFFKEEN